MIPFSKLSSISRTSSLSSTPSHLQCRKAEGLKLAAASWRFLQTSDFTGTASQQSADSSSSPSWLDRIKGVFTGTKAPATAPQPVSDNAQPVPQESVLTMEAFADELKKARKLGSLTQFGKGLPRGGEATVSQSLLRQEAILRALSKYDPQLLGAQQKAQVATECSCTARDVEDVISKYEWAKEAHRRVQQLQAEGKPLPKSFKEVEEMMGGSWSPAASRNLGKTGEVSRNSLCPCGSGKKFKRCCGKESVHAS